MKDFQNKVAVITGAGGGQIPGQGPTDARAGAGDHCYFVLEVFHGLLSRFR